MIGGPTDRFFTPTDPIRPPSPPARDRDSLDGLLLATLFPTVKPYRDRVVDILRVINGTQIGRELLYDFRTLAGNGKYPSVELAEPKEMQQQEAAKPHGLFLSVATLTAGASEIGLAPEVEQAPSVLLRLTEIRNFLAMRGQDGRLNATRIEPLDVPMDPAATALAFRKELEASHASATPFGSRPATPPANTIHQEAATQSPGCLPLRKLSTESQPYSAVTQARDVPSDTPPPGAARRAFRWADQKVQAFRNLVLRRRDHGGTDDCQGQAGAPSPTTSFLPGIVAGPAQGGSTPPGGAASNTSTPDRPIIKESQHPKTSRHKRMPSYINPVRGQGPDSPPSQPTSPSYARKETP